jgi:hypothetical protein
MRKSTQRSVLAAVAALTAALLGLACVSGARSAMAEARTRYEQCVTGASEAKCSAEKERMLATERTYQENAQRAWGCDPAHQDCPTKR